MRIIAYIYLRSTFFVDFVALLPYFLNWLVFHGPVGWQYIYYLKGIRLLANRSINVQIDLLMNKLRA